MEDEPLVRRILDGDNSGFDALLDMYQERVYRLAYRMVGVSDAEDVTQETFVAIYKSLTSFRGQAKLSTWVYRVTVNTCLTWRRRQRPEEVSLLDDFEPADDRYDVEKQALRLLGQERVEQALAELDEAHRLPVILHELHGLTYREIAETMQIPIGTVKSRLFHAFKLLRRSLKDTVAEATYNET